MSIAAFAARRKQQTELGGVVSEKLPVRTPQEKKITAELKAKNDELKDSKVKEASSYRSMVVAIIGASKYPDPEKNKYQIWINKIKLIDPEMDKIGSALLGYQIMADPTFEQLCAHDACKNIFAAGISGKDAYKGVTPAFAVLLTGYFLNDLNFFSALYSADVKLSLKDTTCHSHGPLFAVFQKKPTAEGFQDMRCILVPNDEFKDALHGLFDYAHFLGLTGVKTDEEKEGMCAKVLKYDEFLAQLNEGSKDVSKNVPVVYRGVDASACFASAVSEYYATASAESKPILQRALAQLSAQHITTWRDAHLVTKEQWAQMGIPIGLANFLASQ